MAWLTHGVHSPPEPTACYEKLPRESPRASLKQLHRAHGAQALSQSYHRPQRTTRGWDSEWTQWEASLILVASLLLLVRHLLLEAMHLLLVASLLLLVRHLLLEAMHLLLVASLLLLVRHLLLV